MIRHSPQVIHEQRLGVRAYAMDLRARVVEAYGRGEGSQADVAQRFSVSTRWLQKLLQRRRATGSLAAKPHGGGRTALVSGAAEQRLRQAVAEAPDATLEELRGRLGVPASRMAVFRALRRLKLTRKKKRWPAPSSSGPTCKRSGGSGGSRPPG
jgi:transposase